MSSNMEQLEEMWREQLTLVATVENELSRMKSGTASAIGPARKGLMLMKKRCDVMRKLTIAVREDLKESRKKT